MSLILSGTDGLSDVDGTAATPAIRGTDANTGIFFPAADTIAFAEGGAECARFDSSGNLGIGTSSPTQKLHVNSSGAAIALIQSTQVAGNTNVETRYTSTNRTWGVGQNIIQTSSIFEIADITAGATRLAIDSSGNLLVGTTTAGAKFTLQYDGGVVVGQNINDSANTTNSTLMQFLIQGTQVGTIKRVGATSAVIYNTSSDYRLKTVVGAVTGQGDRIDALKPINYLWKEGNTSARGFLAHEFQEVYASSVSGDKDAVDANGNPVYQAMQASTSEVIADLVAEIQSLRKRLAALENK